MVPLLLGPIALVGTRAYGKGLPGLPRKALVSNTIRHRTQNGKEKRKGNKKKLKRKKEKKGERRETDRQTDRHRDSKTDRQSDSS